MAGLLPPKETENVLGHAEVRQLFRVPKVGTVAGCYVSDGNIQRNLRIRVLREYVEIYEGEIDSLKRFKDDVREVNEGYECGISIVGYNDLKVGDVIESYRVDAVAVEFRPGRYWGRRVEDVRWYPAILDLEE